ncbi:glycosyltransferase family 4 protein [Massilia sp. IC2-477]|uniref:glycosyltransferase family 4 protein n=1 Tax=Massilia sp. IC2-477 TaxID=2887198 RepID=UPI001D125C1A|nr:glycosyltransferase family 4 protein [Massilia sp. IC2-477]MCC2956193.1 glycosyltransferase family 4 protein [Massilia sp. IC2-477]
MNILLINHYAGSVHHGMEYRPYYLAREWVRLGHRVRIVAASHAHVRTRQPALAGRSRRDENIDGIDYTWFATPPYRGNDLARVRNMGAFVLRLWVEARRLTREFAPDVVIASSTYPLDIWPAHRIARLAGARLLHEVHDLWPLSPMELGGFSRRHPFIRLLQAAEDYACRHADTIVSILPKVREHLEARGMAPHKLHLIPNGLDPAEWLAAPPALPEALDALLSGLRAQGLAVVGYAGSHGLANALDTLLEAASLMKNQPLAFVLVGDGPEKPRLERRARELGLARVHFVAPVAKVQIPALMARLDIAYLGWQRQPLYRFGIAPNKLLDYMMGGCPVLHAVEAGNDPVREAGCGITVAPEDPAAVARGLAALLAMSRAERRALGERGRAHALANLTYPVLGRRFLTTFAHEVPHG